MLQKRLATSALLASPVQKGSVSFALFVYGTLELPEVFYSVAGVRKAYSPAFAPDFRRALLRRRVYPGMTPHPGRVTTGRVYEGLDREHLARLDAFEGSEYERREIPIWRVQRGRSIAWAYVIPEERAGVLTETPWDREAFTRNEAGAYIARLE